MNIILATGNVHKVDELSAMLDGANLSPAPGGFDPAETGDTLVANALIKANALRALIEPNAPDAIVLADDSGLSVHALDGRPGVFSARYAGLDATYADNCDLLLAELGERTDRGAVFVCVLAALMPDGRTLIAVGTCPGDITTAARGEGGFGYDPVFRPLGDARTMAEMAPDEKAAVSHRGRAVRRVAHLLGIGPDR